MSDALPLPPRPNLEQYKKLAKDFQSACRSDDPAAVSAWAARWADTPEAARIEPRWRKFKETNPRAAGCRLADAQLFVALAHGFASWPKFTRHLKELVRAQSPVSKFEAAVDAIVSGDSATLDNMLKENPELVRVQSTRAHRSTLLHHVSANGVEDFRQKTPRNIVEIAKLLLDAGADVNAESDAYGGRSTTLGLTATSWHPEKAGVQIRLMEILIAHGAIFDGSEVNACLHNGRGEAAEFLANRGAHLDLEGAAGVGRLDLAMSFFNHDGTLKPSATHKQMQDGLAWACEYGRTEAADFLWQRTIAVDGLHWAAFGGHPDIVKLLLDRGASVDARDDRYGATPLGWAIYAWGEAAIKRERFYEVVALLVRAGAKPDPQWEEKISADSRMLAALRGET